MLCASHQFEELGNVYVRSFSLLDGKLYLVSGLSNRKIICVSPDDFEILAEYPVPDELAGMVQLTRIDGWYYLTISTDEKGDQSAANIVRVRELEDLAEGAYESVYSLFDGIGTPYYITEADGEYYMTLHRDGGSVWRFASEDGELTRVERIY